MVPLVGMERLVGVQHIFMLFDQVEKIIDTFSITHCFFLSIFFLVKKMLLTPGLFLKSELQIDEVSYIS